MEGTMTPSVYTTYEGCQFVWSGNTIASNLTAIMQELSELGINGEDVVIQSFPDKLAVYVRETKWTLRVSSLINVVNGYGEKLNQ